jgi:hypothetical protein
MVQDILMKDDAVRVEVWDQGGLIAPSPQLDHTMQTISSSLARAWEMSPGSAEARSGYRPMKRRPGVILTPKIRARNGSPCLSSFPNASVQERNATVLTCNPGPIRPSMIAPTAMIMMNNLRAVECAGVGDAIVLH